VNADRYESPDAFQQAAWILPPWRENTGARSAPNVVGEIECFAPDLENPIINPAQSGMQTHDSVSVAKEKRIKKKQTRGYRYDDTSADTG
jgi:hypothetical protein